jgi:hypothetical protein
MPVDPGLAFLNQTGFNLVQRHEVRLAPLDVLGRDDVLVKLGPVTRLFKSGAALPAPRPPAPAAAMTGQQTGGVHNSLARRLLANIVKGFGGELNLAALDSISAQVGFLRFQFRDVILHEVDLVALGHYLAASSTLGNPLTQRYVLNPDADAFVTTAVLESNSIAFQPMGANFGVVRLDVPKFVSAITGDATVLDENEWIALRGPRTATFAFACHRLTHTATGWSLVGPTLIAPGTRVHVRPSIPPVSRGS